jgi:hypothetical protein
MSLAGVASTANGQDRTELAPVALTATLLNHSAIPAVRTFDPAQSPAPVNPIQPRRTGSTALLNSLYVSTAAMQALDVHSTLAAFRAGAAEANPLMADIAKHRGPFVAVKAAVAASTILAARQIAKRNKVAAVMTMVAVNGAYAMVVRHNYKVARGR